MATAATGEHRINIVGTVNDVHETDYHGPMCGIVSPCSETAEEHNATTGIKRYVIEDFNLERWFSVFFSDETDLITSKIDKDTLTRLVIADLPESMNNHGLGDALKVKPIDDSAPFPLQLIRKRADFLGFPLTTNGCVLIALLSSTPAVAVMYTVAYACMWQRTLHERALNRVPLASLDYQRPGVAWMLCGNDMEQEFDTVYIPGADHIKEMWELQKRKPGPGQTDNALDSVRSIQLDPVAEPV